MAPPVIDATELPARRAILVEQGAGGPIKRVGQDLGPSVALRGRKVLEAHRQGQELAQRVPAQVVLLDELLDMLGS